MLKILYKIYFWLVAVPLYAIATALTATTVIVGRMFGGEKFFSYYPGMVWSRLATVLTLCPVKVTGREHITKGQSYVFVSNHQSAFDIFLIYGHLGVPIKWMMKKGLEKIPLVGLACKKAGFIFVDNSSAKAAQKSVLEAKEKIKNSGGSSLIVFPEGGRTKDGHLQAFKRGAYLIAMEMQLPIVPITLNGTYKVMKMNSFNIMPHRLEMFIHEALAPPPDMGKEHLQALADTTRETIFASLWKEFQ
ncbi:MAG: 1-acyl-sn-glycerol-3-phosphate acyltransferase [Tannerella sp.]|jgi:1-acyl-sn-glycerol-3-phosphate acyltransferase|nr:1-acyl-sn-glycerol-3-phosphate acyltransferase [Tannerella sp.]